MSRRSARGARRRQERDDPHQLVFEYRSETAGELPVHKRAPERASRKSAPETQRESNATKRVALGGGSAILLDGEPKRPEMSAIESYPPLLTVQETAELLRLRVSTIYRHVSEGKYRKAVKRGKPLRFYRDQLVKEFMK